MTSIQKADAVSSGGQASDIQREARLKQLATFVEVHDIVTNFKPSEQKKNGFQPLTDDEIKDYSHWADDLRQAMKEGTSFPTEDFIAHTAALTAKLNEHERKLVGADGIFYGGEVGNEIFQKMNKAYLEPVLKAEVESFRLEVGNHAYNDQVTAAGKLLDHLIDVSASVRNMIARMTSSNHANEIGVRRDANADTRMIDLCDASQYKVWKGDVTKAASSIISGYPGLAEWRRDGKSLADFVAANGKGENGKVAIEWIADGRVARISVDTSQDPPVYSGSLHAHPFNSEASYYEFNWKEQPDHSLLLDQLKCHHPTLADNNIVKTGAEDFLTIVKGDSLASADTGVRSFTYRISNSSTYLRGQQACMEKILDAALSTQGMQVVRSDDYDKSKGNPSEDQHALFCTTREEFMQQSKGNLKVVNKMN